MVGPAFQAAFVEEVLIVAGKCHDFARRGESREADGAITLLVFAVRILGKRSDL